MKLLRTVGKIMTGFVILSGFCLPLHAENSNLLQPNDIVAIGGDAGDFSKLFAAYLAACRPVEHVRVWVCGDRGAISQELLDKRVDDMLLFRPTVAILCCGLREGNHKRSENAFLTRYIDRLTQAVQKLKNGGVRAILICSPTALDPDVYNESPNPVTYEDYRANLVELSEAAQAVARTEGVGFIDLYTPMFETIKTAKAKFGVSYRMTGADKIYPSRNSDIVLADTLLKAFNLDGDLGKVVLDMGTGEATTTPGHKVLSADKTKVEIESLRYPFCFANQPLNLENPTDPRSALLFTPFQKARNRYLLMIKNPPGALNVTWRNHQEIFCQSFDQRNQLGGRVSPEPLFLSV